MGLHDVVRLAPRQHPHVQRDVGVERQRLEDVPGQRAQVVTAERDVLQHRGNQDVDDMDRQRQTSAAVATPHDGGERQCIRQISAVQQGCQRGGLRREARLEPHTDE